MEYFKSDAAEDTKGDSQQMLAHPQCPKRTNGQAAKTRGRLINKTV